MSIKICRKQHLSKSCKAKWRANKHNRTFKLPKINETVLFRVGGKLTKFRGHEKINEKHESFYPRKFLAVRYSTSVGLFSVRICVLEG